LKRLLEQQKNKKIKSCWKSAFFGLYNNGLLKEVKFNYIAQTKTGKKRTGTVEASDLKKAKEKLLEKDWILVSIDSVEKKKKRKNIFPFLGRISFLDKFLFVKHLGMMIKAGLPLREAIFEIQEQTGSRKFKRVLDDIISCLDNGESLADSLAKHPAVFDELFVNLIKAGEASGTLEENLKYLISQLEKNHDLKNKVKAALFYPALILSSTFALVGILAIYILPKLLPLFESFEIQLPLPTRILIWVIRLFQNHGFIIFIQIIVLILIFVFISRFRSVKKINHRILLRLPIIGKLNRNVNLAYFSRTLGTLIGSGIPIIEALNITANTLTNAIYREQLKASIVRIQHGEEISSHLKTKPNLFPPVFCRMINVGEKTGKLDDSFIYLARFYEKEVSDTARNLSTILEPLLLIIIGLVIGFIAVSIIMPIYEITHGLSGLRR